MKEDVRSPVAGLLPGASHEEKRRSFSLREEDTTMKHTAPLYRVTAHGDNEATLKLRGDVVISYWRPLGGGYVREVSGRQPGTSGLQVCRGLAHMGSTLYCAEHQNLARMIRREARTTAGRAILEDRVEDAEYEARDG